MNSLKYRPDIDGLRAFAVFIVIAFHSDLKLFQGGYIGVDIFFVISGFLITSIIVSSNEKNSFCFLNFYKKRIVRLLPALILTLTLTLIFGLIFYNSSDFDYHGKVTFFSALGIANILFSEGSDYFAQNQATHQLTHLWSLGVEEQFYIAWPFIVIIFSRTKTVLIILSLILLIASLSASIISSDTSPNEAYFLPQYRIFELMTGAITAFIYRSRHYRIFDLGKLKEIPSLISIILIIFCTFSFSSKTLFPSHNAFYPCIATSLLILFPSKSISKKFLSAKPLVFIGIISYPLYLYHHPFISYIHFFELTENPLYIIIITLTLAIPSAWITYKFIESPIRKSVHQKRAYSSMLSTSLIISIITIAAIGLIIAKTNGLPQRYKLLNRFAFDISTRHQPTFHNEFPRGYNVDESSSHGKILFVGDSVLQQYISPLCRTAGIPNQEVDTVTRGGCVLLKEVKFNDKFSDIPYEFLYEKLYNSKKTYETIVISQNWKDYNEVILNKLSDDALDKWTPYIEETINHFLPICKKLIIIATHPEIEGTQYLQPDLFIKREIYLKNLKRLRIINQEYLNRGYNYFEKWKSDKIIIIHPSDLWTKLHDGQWSFFYHSDHITRASSPFLSKQLSVGVMLK